MKAYLLAILAVVPVAWLLGIVIDAGALDRVLVVDIGFLVTIGIFAPVLGLAGFLVNPAPNGARITWTSPPRSAPNSTKSTVSSRSNASKA